MSSDLHRFHQAGQLHFLTFSCHGRQPYLGDASRRDLFESALERIRSRYRWAILGYVVMPEHVHLLVNEPPEARLGQAIQALKLSVAKRLPERPFWLANYYDLNVWSAENNAEKLHYIHTNPVTRGLVTKPEDWQWSSARHYATGSEGTVEIESFWTAWRREHGGSLPKELVEGGSG